MIFQVLEVEGIAYIRSVWNEAELEVVKYPSVCTLAWSPGMSG